MKAGQVVGGVVATILCLVVIADPRVELNDLRLVLAVEAGWVPAQLIHYLANYLRHAYRYFLDRLLLGNQLENVGHYLGLDCF